MDLKRSKYLFKKDLNYLLFNAHTLHKKYHNENEVQMCTLLSIKTGGCPEDCGYCSQSIHSDQPMAPTKLMSLEEVKQKALDAKENGSMRFCMGAAWRKPSNKNLERVIEMIKVVKSTGLEACVTLGMLTKQQASMLRDAGLDYYNHNIDTSENYYKEIITTRTFQDRIDTLDNVREAGVKVCSGGIIGMGESAEHRAAMLETLSNLNPYPESVPINALVAVEGTPMEEQEQIPIWDMIRMVATTRIVLPKTTVRLSAGRTQMTNEGQALCFLAGAGSIFAGDKLLTTPNPDINQDMELFKNLGLVPQKAYKKGDKPDVNENYKTSLADGKPKWSRPSHKIETNINAMKNGKLKRKLNQKL